MAKDACALDDGWPLRVERDGAPTKYGADGCSPDRPRDGGPAEERAQVAPGASHCHLAHHTPRSVLTIHARTVLVAMGSRAGAGVSGAVNALGRGREPNRTAQLIAPAVTIAAAHQNAVV